MTIGVEVVAVAGAACESAGQLFACFAGSGLEPGGQALCHLSMPQSLFAHYCFWPHWALVARMLSFFLHHKQNCHCRVAPNSSGCFHWLCSLVL